MTFPRFVSNLSMEFVKKQHQRAGQVTMNYLHGVDSALYTKVATSGFDPFYDDSKIEAALSYLEANWTGTEDETSQ